MKTKWRGRIHFFYIEKKNLYIRMNKDINGQLEKQKKGQKKKYIMEET